MKKTLTNFLYYVILIVVEIATFSIFWKLPVLSAISLDMGISIIEVNMPKGIAKNPEEKLRKLRIANLGKIIPKEVREKISKTLTGNIPWNKGKIGIYSEKHKRKISEALKIFANKPNIKKDFRKE